MVRSDADIRTAMDSLGTKWKYNDESPVSHRAAERGASEALQDALENNIDTETVHEFLGDSQYEAESLKGLFEFGYVDSVLWYLEKETLVERIDENNDPVVRDRLEE